MSVSNEKVPISEKLTLTLEEAAAYSNIGVNKLREIMNEADCTFVLFVGNKRLIKRQIFESTSMISVHTQFNILIAAEKMIVVYN